MLCLCFKSVLVGFHFYPLEVASIRHIRSPPREKKWEKPISDFSNIRHFTYYWKAQLGVVVCRSTEGAYSFPHPRKPHAPHWSREHFSIWESRSDGDQSGFGTNTCTLDTLVLIFVLSMLACSVPWKASRYNRTQITGPACISAHWTWATISGLQLRCCSGTNSRSFWHAELLNLLSAWGIQKPSRTTKQLEEEILMKVSFNSHMLKGLCKVERKSYIPEVFLTYCLLHTVDKLLTLKDFKYNNNTALICSFSFSLFLLVFDGGNRGFNRDLPADKVSINFFAQALY